MRKNELRIGPDNQRGNGALRESLKMKSDNTIPEKMSQPTFISIEINNAPNRPLMNLPKRSLRIHDKEDQRKNSERKGNVALSKCAIHLLKLTPF
jgi:hypothetical protein